MASEADIEEAVVWAARWARYKEDTIHTGDPSIIIVGKIFSARNPNRSMSFIPGDRGRYAIRTEVWQVADIPQGKQDLELVAESLSGAFGPRFHRRDKPNGSCS